MFENDVVLGEFLEFLGDLSIEGRLLRYVWLH